jgi:hypothetical protein
MPARAGLADVRRSFEVPVDSTTILIVILLVVLFGGGGFFWSRRGI